LHFVAGEKVGAHKRHFELEVATKKKGRRKEERDNRGTEAEGHENTGKARAWKEKETAEKTGERLGKSLEIVGEGS